MHEPGAQTLNLLATPMTQLQLQLHCRFCDGTTQPDATAPLPDQCGEHFDGRLVWSCFYSQWAPVPVPSILRPLRMHGVWSPRCVATNCKGTIMSMNGVTAGTARFTPAHNTEGATFGPACLWSALLGETHTATTPGGADHWNVDSMQRENIDPLPSSISAFRVAHSKLPNCSLYQLPAAVVALAAAIESVLALGRGPIVLLGYSLSGAVVIETAARVFHDHPPGWLAGVCVLAPQGAGVHCDNRGKVNSMVHASRMLGAVGCPLSVYHGGSDKLIPSHVGKQVAAWHAEGAASNSGPGPGPGHEDTATSLTSFHVEEHDDHGVTFAGPLVRDFVVTQLGA
eukprot:COSAG02_NODE_7927_length_2783_cov_1.544337_5_plen_341_part_00